MVSHHQSASCSLLLHLMTCLTKKWNKSQCFKHSEKKKSSLLEIYGVTSTHQINCSVIWLCDIRVCTFKKCLELFYYCEVFFFFLNFLWNFMPDSSSLVSQLAPKIITCVGCSEQSWLMTRSECGVAANLGEAVSCTWCGVPCARSCAVTSLRCRQHGPSLGAMSVDHVTAHSDLSVSLKT